MYIIVSARILVLNGINVIKQIPLKTSRVFNTAEEVDEYRKRTLARRKDGILKAYAKKHPGETPPTVDLLLTVKSKKGYSRPLLPKKRKTDE